MQIGCGLLGAGLTLLTACDAELYHELDEHTVNESLLSLRQAGLRPVGPARAGTAHRRPRARQRQAGPSAR